MSVGSPDTARMQVGLLVVAGMSVVDGRLSCSGVDLIAYDMC